MVATLNDSKSYRFNELFVGVSFKFILWVNKQAGEQH